MCLLVGTRDEAGLLPSHISTQAAHALHGLAEQGMVQVASGLKMPTQVLGLLAGAGGQEFLIDIVNPFCPLVEPALLNALLPH